MSPRELVVVLIAVLAWLLTSAGLGALLAVALGP